MSAAESELTATLKRCLECACANEPGEPICTGCGHAEFSPPRPTATDLCCDHCGDVAVESPTGIFHEDMADKCVSCGFPGQAHVDEGDAYWSSDRDNWCARCESDNCSECGGANRDEAEYLRGLAADTGKKTVVP